MPGISRGWMTFPTPSASSTRALVATAWVAADPISCSRPWMRVEPVTPATVAAAITPGALDFFPSGLARIVGCKYSQAKMIGHQVVVNKTN